MSTSDKIVTIASANSVQADLIKMYLEGQGLSVFLHGEYAGTLIPHIASPAGFGAVRVQVHESQEEEARLLLKQIEGEIAGEEAKQ